MRELCSLDIAQFHSSAVVDETEYHSVDRHRSPARPSYLVSDCEISSDDSLYDPDFEIESENLKHFSSSSGSDTDCEDTEQEREIRHLPNMTANIPVTSYGATVDESVNNEHSAVSGEVSLFSKRPKKRGCKKTYDKINYCTFCHKAIKSKISRHLLTVHIDEPQVKEILLLEKRCKKRIALLQVLANEGNLKHNADVFKDGKGCVVVGRRNCSVKRRAAHYLPCEFCKKFVVKNSLWRHFRTCQIRKESQMQNKAAGEGVRSNVVKNARIFLNSVVLEDDERLLNSLIERMRDDVVKETVLRDQLIRRFACLRLESLGRKADQKIADVNRVSQGVRTLGRIVLEAQKTLPDVTLDGLIKPSRFDLVVKIAKLMSTDKEKPALNVGRLIGHLLRHVVLTKSGVALRENNDLALQEANGFKKLHEAEWNFRVNSAAVKRINKEKRSKVTPIPLTEDLQLLRTHILQKMKKCLLQLRSSCLADDWLQLAKLTMSRLILFNKRRRAEVKDLKVEEYLQRPKWHDDVTGEMKLALSPVDNMLAKR